MLRRIILVCLAALATPSAPAMADTFPLPSVQEYHSANGEFVVTVIPARLSCTPKESECVPAARAIVERLVGDDRADARTIRLLNSQAPAMVFLTDDGARLLTVDDYAGGGHGPNVVVVYDAEGAVLARYALSDILPEDYIAGLHRSVSTIRWWHSAPVIEPRARRATLSILKPDRDGDRQRALRDGGVEIALDLETGMIARPAGPEWENARNCARANSWLVSVSQRARYRGLCR